MNPTALAIATLGPPALFGIAVLIDDYRKRRRRIRYTPPLTIELPTTLDRLDRPDKDMLERLERWAAMYRHPATRPRGPEDDPRWPA